MSELSWQEDIERLRRLRDAAQEDAHHALLRLYAAQEPLRNGSTITPEQSAAVESRAAEFNQAIHDMNETSTAYLECVRRALGI